MNELEQKLIGRIEEFLEKKGVRKKNVSSLMALADTFQKEARRQGQDQVKRKIQTYMGEKTEKLEQSWKEKEYEVLEDTVDDMLKYLEEGNAKK